MSKQKLTSLSIKCRWSNAIIKVRVLECQTLLVLRSNLYVCETYCFSKLFSDIFPLWQSGMPWTCRLPVVSPQFLFKWKHFSFYFVGSFRFFTCNSFLISLPNQTMTIGFSFLFKSMYDNNSSLILICVNVIFKILYSAKIRFFSMVFFF